MERFSNQARQHDEDSEEDYSEEDYYETDGESTLISLASEGEIDEIPALLQAGCRVNARDFSGETALHVLAHVSPASQHYEAFKIMMELKTKQDSDEKSSGTDYFHNESELYRKAHNKAALKCMPEVINIVKLVIEAGADVNLVDCEDETPLTYAAKYGFFFLIPTLVKGTKCKVSHTNRWGRQALDYLAGFNGTGDDIHPSSRDPAIITAAIEAIIQEGGDVDKPSLSGVTPFEMVLNHSQSDLFVPFIKYSVATHDKIIDVVLTECRFAAVRMMLLAGWSFPSISSKVKKLSLDGLRKMVPRSFEELIPSMFNVKRENEFTKEREDAFITLQAMVTSPLQLKDQARIAIRRCVGVRRLRELPLPKVMLDFITLKYE